MTRGMLGIVGCWAPGLLGSWAVLFWALGLGWNRGLGLDLDQWME